MSVVNHKVLIFIKIWFISTNDGKISNEGCFFASISQYKIYGILRLPQNIVTEIKKTAHIRKL